MHRLCLSLSVVSSCLFVNFAHADPVNLRCEFRENPIGIDCQAPRLSWQSDSTERNWEQSAYQVLVATSAERLRAGRADIWDSGRRDSGESVGIVYDGPALASQTRYFWTVKVWDHRGRVSQATTHAWWEMGLLERAEWAGAQWISWSDPDEAPDRERIRWVWMRASGDTGSTRRSRKLVFRRVFQLDSEPRNAALFLVSKTDITATVNGKPIRGKNGWIQFDRQDVTALLTPGPNVVEVVVGGRGTKRIGFAGLVKIERIDGSCDRIPTDATWTVREDDATADEPAEVVGGLDDPAFGGPDAPGDLPGAAARLRREFTVTQDVARARLYVTALGNYRMFINGTRIGTDELTPEFTNYNKRVIYQTYDVTAQLQHGQNAIAALLGDGWFGSGLGWDGERFYFMPGPTRLLARLRIDYADGSQQSIVTDGTWNAAGSPILHSELYAGEVYDARLEEAGWDRPSFDDHGWTPAQVNNAPPATLSAPLTDPVRIVDTIRPLSVLRSPSGGYIYDMGQNMVGWVRLNVSGPAGTRVQLEFAEQITPDGELSPASMRNANATDVYVLSGRGEESYAPHFTFHGFRYVEMRGYPGGEPPLDALVGKVISSIHQITGRIETSSELVNKMYDLAIWGQRGNFVSVPTDCPQRDERLGYTGDAQVFWRTGSYNADIAAFAHHFLRNMVDEQTEAGGFTNTAPGVPKRNLREGSPGWADAGIIIPWTTWMQYGDRGIVDDNWEAMNRFMDYILSINPEYIRNKGGSQLGDWLNMNAPTPADLIATGLWAIDAEMMSQMAAATGRDTDAAKYRELGARLRSTFQAAFIKEDGTIGNGSQASYVLAFTAKMVPEALKEAAIGKLVADIEAHDWHLTTGFLSSPYLLSVLAENGRTDVAYRLLLNETCPSWGYMIRQGATTWWERWNSDASGDAMNSFNHYAFGSVVAWIYRNVTGIDVAPDGAGFRRIVIRPRLDPRLTHARGEYDSVYGKIVTDWIATPPERLVLKVTIPANTRATVYLPDIPDARVTEGGELIQAKRTGGWNVVEIGSGSYDFAID